MPLEPGITAGETASGFRWRNEISVVADAATTAGTSGISLYRTALTLTWTEGGQERDISLSSLRVDTPGAWRR
jgi:hypothetical protein